MPQRANRLPWTRESRSKDFRKQTAELKYRGTPAPREYPDDRQQSELCLQLPGARLHARAADVADRHRSTQTPMPDTCLSSERPLAESTHDSWMEHSSAQSFLFAGGLPVVAAPV